MGVSYRNPNGMYFLVAIILFVGGVALVIRGAHAIGFGVFRSWTPWGTYVNASGTRARLIGWMLCALGAGILYLERFAVRIS
jgi:hypothetical protein